MVRTRTYWRIGYAHCAPGASWGGNADDDDDDDDDWWICILSALHNYTRHKWRFFCLFKTARIAIAKFKLMMEPTILADFLWCSTFSSCHAMRAMLCGLNEYSIFGQFRWHLIREAFKVCSTVREWKCETAKDTKRITKMKTDDHDIDETLSTNFLLCAFKFKLRNFLFQNLNPRLPPWSFMRAACKTIDISFHSAGTARSLTQFRKYPTIYTLLNSSMVANSIQYFACICRSFCCFE